jgi:hypothetical protein
MLEALKRDSAIWLQERLIIKVVDAMARINLADLEQSEYPVNQIIDNFKRGLLESQAIFSQLGDLKNKLNSVAQTSGGNFHMPNEVWVDGIFELFLAYVYDESLEDDAVLSALSILYYGRVASNLIEIQSFSEQIRCCSQTEISQLQLNQIFTHKDKLAQKFWELKPQLIHNWLEKAEVQKPPLVPLGYMEYVPGKPVVVPKKMVGKDGHVVQTDNVYRAVRKRYEDAFNRFMYEGLGLPENTDPGTLVSEMEKFMQQMELALERILPGDLHTEKGIREFVNRLFQIVRREKIFTIHADLLREMLIRFPPVNLMIPLGYYKPAKLLQNVEARDAVTYANLLESWSYTDRDLLWVLEQLKPESFQWVELKPVFIDEKAMGFWPHSKVANLNKITARITVKPLQPGVGGKYPRMRYFTSIIRRICVAEDYSQVFTLIVKQRKNINTKIKNALFDLQKGDESSAHNVFENFHHRLMVEKMRQ